MGLIHVDQILVTPLKRMQFGGDVLHALKHTDLVFSILVRRIFFINFGEIKDGSAIFEWP